MKRFFLLVALLCIAGPQVTTASEDETARKNIAASFPGVTPEDVRPSPVKGLYEVTVGPVVVYASPDGRYLVRGEIHDMQTDRNLTQARMGEARARALADLNEDELIVFGEDDARHSITVFTDVDCGYCRMMHGQIDEYIKRGIRVRYAAYPRNGMASRTWQTMQNVWCAPDPEAALTAAKLDKKFEGGQCMDDDIVAKQWQLGRMLGVRGTPAIFTTNGQMIPGYLKPDDLLKRLQALQAGK